ncbi:toxin-antitoxin system, toxin component family protein [Streptomyces verrucosisporus]|uniref:toxin-antitoxin system, toxin component family protein n=1 Tax=Streptomyces verrucosisporus TaxID=1695161 RepID=UPI0019D1707A|nr:toxin-antitoxin system, toxin component family protein [Streptomyces verrucosisporus]MBN3932119.1 toxin-antitoxin system, toxin component family protein [Streptomyces verrucosisporus]
MDELARRLMDGLSRDPVLQVPTDAESLCRALCREMGTLRGRPLELRVEELPREAGGITGLMLSLEERDVILVERRVDAPQKPIIVGHELWHLHRGHSSYPSGAEGGTAAARMLYPGDGTVLCAAARSHCDAREEGEAEAFGVRLYRDFRRWLVDDPLAVPRPARTDAVVTRLRTTLGPR